MLAIPTTRPRVGADAMPVTATESPSGSAPLDGIVIVTRSPATARTSTGSGAGGWFGLAGVGAGFTVTCARPTAWSPSGFCTT